MVGFVSFSFTSCPVMSRNPKRYGRIAPLACRCSVRVTEKCIADISKIKQIARPLESTSLMIGTELWTGSRMPIERHRVHRCIGGIAPPQHYLRAFTNRCPTVPETPWNIIEISVILATLFSTSSRSPPLIPARYRSFVADMGIMDHTAS